VRGYYDATQDGILDEFEQIAASLADSAYTDWQRSPDWVPDKVVPISGVHPDIVLQYPTVDETIPDLVEFVFTSRRWNSIYGLINKAVEFVWMDLCGNPTNPLEEVLSGLAGDWNQVALSSDALGHLAAYHHELALHIRAAVTLVRETWSGNSSDAAQAYFDQLCAALDEMVPALRTVSSDYSQVAFGMWMLAQGLAGLIPAVVTICKLVAATAAVGAATSWSLIGPILSGVGIGAQAVVLVSLLLQVRDVWCAMISVVDVFIGCGAGFTGARYSLDTIQNVDSINAPYLDPLADRK
jgi:uncharacterized protein YukE